MGEVVEGLDVRQDHAVRAAVVEERARFGGSVHRSDPVELRTRIAITDCRPSLLFANDPSSASLGLGVVADTMPAAAPVTEAAS